MLRSPLNHPLRHPRIPQCAFGGYFIRTVTGVPVILFGTAFEALHLLEAFLQAYIFTLLSAAYIAEAMSAEH